jgi:hypothetical protein
MTHGASGTHKAYRTRGTKLINRTIIVNRKTKEKKYLYSFISVPKVL